jgi:hypothetical protein
VRSLDFELHDLFGRPMRVKSIGIATEYVNLRNIFGVLKNVS